MLLMVWYSYAAVVGAANTSADMPSLETYLEQGSNSIVRRHSLLIAQRLNRLSICSHHTAAAAAAAAADGELLSVIRSSLLTSLCTLPLRDVVSY